MRRVATIVMGVVLAAQGLGGLACVGGGRQAPGPVVNAVDAVPDRPQVADMSAITDQEVDALTQWLVPLVEEAGGAKFTTPPVGELGTPERLAGILESETREIVGTIYDVPPDVVEKMAAGARVGIPGLLGKYATSTGKVYLSPSGAAGLQAAHGDAKAAFDVVTLVMAHELGHALQDQVGNLDAVMKDLKDLEHFDGMRGITEGQANWITLRVARKLGLEDAFWDMSSGQGWGKTGLVEPQAFDVWMLYGQGMAFSEHHAAKGGTDALWDIVKAPPRTTTALFRPERYGSANTETVGLSEALTGVETALTRTADWVVADTMLGEAVLRREALGLDAARVDRVLGGLKWGHERRMYVPSGASVRPRSASVMVVGFESAEQARELVELLTDGLEAQAAARTAAEAEMAENFPGVMARNWVVESKRYDRVEGDAVIQRVVGPLSANGARLASEEEQGLWVTRGNLLAVVTVSGFRPGNRLDKAVNLLFDQIAAQPKFGLAEPE